MSGSPTGATRLGRIVILNGAPRSGKSSIVAALQESVGSVWMNLGVDLFARFVVPRRLRPGIGLRPGGERPDIEELLPVLYAALYDSIAAQSRLGLDVVADVGHHEAHSRPLGILPACARRLRDFPVLFVGVHCPIETIMERRRASGPCYAAAPEGTPVPLPVLAWQREIHRPGLYDLEIDTSVLDPRAAAAAILDVLAQGIPASSAFEKLAALAAPEGPA